MNSEEEEIPAIELGDFPQSQVRDALERVLTSPEFVRSKRISAFLRYVVEETLAGRGDRLKAFTIAMDVYERDESFDPRTDTIVRVEAGRLRRRLKHYYATAGRDDPVHIDLPKGGYTPKFHASNETASDIDGESVENRRDEAGEIQGRRRPPARAVVLVAALVMVSIGIAVWWSAPWQQGSPMAQLPKIAVLQFSNLRGDAKDSYLARGITTELVAALARYQHMVVVSRAVSARYGNVNADVRDIGRDLSARFVIRGSVLRDETHLNVTAELADTISAEVVWVESYGEPLVSAKAYEITASMAGHIARAVARPYGAVYREMVRTMPASNFSSYQCVLKAYEYERNPGPEEHRETRDCLERTVEHEPDYATAWILLTQQYLDEYRDGYNPRAEYNPLDRALEAARHAVRLAPENSEAHWALALAYYFRKQFTEFHESGEQAMALGANNADVVADFGFKLSISGQWKRGLELVEQAKRMSPVHPSMWHFPHALDFYRRHAYDDALATSLKIDIPKLYMTYVVRAMIYGQLGRTEEGRDAVAQIMKRKPNFGKDVRNDFRRRNVPGPLIEHIVEGLRKAGLQIPSED